METANENPIPAMETANENQVEIALPEEGNTFFCGKQFSRRGLVFSGVAMVLVISAVVTISVVIATQENLISSRSSDTGK